MEAARSRVSPARPLYVCGCGKTSELLWNTTECMLFAVCVCVMSLAFAHVEWIHEE